jgi:hypothetical protein
VDSSFSSWGSARFYDDLNRIDYEAALSGTHTVTGPSLFETSVYGYGVYSYELSGPAQPGACYGTSLSVSGNPSGFLRDTLYGSWSGETRCAPNPGNGDGGGDLNQECSEGTGCGSPIVLDAGGGYHLTALADGVAFDLRNEGVRRRVAWTIANLETAFLALDRNENGQIDNGAELFGNYTRLRSGVLAPNGFIALGELDDNADAIIDSRDEAWAMLLLWTDRNHDGDSTPDELQPIAQSEVVSLGSDYRAVGKRDQWGNLFRYASEFGVEKNGRRHRRPYYDVFFRIAL